MLNPIRDVSEEERNKRALLVLHGLTFLEDPAFLKDNHKDNHKGYHKKLRDDIYIMTHSVIGCVAKNCPVVQEGLRRIEELEDSLKQANIIDVEKILSGEHNASENPKF